MAVARLTPWPRTGTVREDWLAWLPPGKEEVFDATYEELEIANTVLGVILNDAFTLCQHDKQQAAREQALVFAELFERLAGRLRAVLSALTYHGRRFHTPANAAPLRVDFFRSDCAQSVARTSALFSVVRLRARARFLHKVRAIGKVIAELHEQTQSVAGAVGEGAASRLAGQWALLEVLHYDLNTCVRETTIVLKSFFCALPNEELAPFRKRLFALVPAIALRSSRTAHVVTKIVPANRQPAGRGQRVAGAVYANEGNHPQPRLTDKDNSRSGASIPSMRMRPDGTGGPNETN